METVDIDATDEAIIAILNEDSRTPDEEIAEQVGVPPHEVNERIDRLQADGVITKFTAMLDASTLGYVTVAFGLSVKPGNTDDIATQLSEYENIYKLWILSGRHNIIAHANFRDITEFQKFSSDVLHSIDGIANYETSIATKSVINEGDVVLPGE